MIKSDDKLLIVNVYVPFLAIPNTFIDPEAMFPFDVTAASTENDRRKMVGTKILSNAYEIAKRVILEDNIDLLLVCATDPKETICQLAKEHNVGAIVTGTRGLGTIERILLGSISSYIVQHAHVPVVVAR